MTIARDIAAWISGSETKKGPVELATQAEVDAGTATDKVLTPSTLAGADLVLPGALIEVEVLESNGTWSKPAGCKWVEVWCVGGGGGGAGVGCSVNPEWRIGGAGGGAGGVYAFFDADNFGATVTVVVGSGGSGGAAGNNAGSNGGLSSFNGTSGSYYCYAVQGYGGGAAAANNLGTPGIGGGGAIAGAEFSTLGAVFRGSAGGGGYRGTGQVRGSDGGGAPFGNMSAALAPPAVITAGGFIGGDPIEYGAGGGGAVAHDVAAPLNLSGRTGESGYVMVKSYG